MNAIFVQRAFLSVAIFGLLIPIAANAAISRNLKLGDRGPDVRELQQILNRDPETKLASSGPGSPGNETDYFGPLTDNAVRRLQQKYASEILAPIGLTAPTGFVGAQTRAFLARLSTGLNPAPPPTALNAPVIVSISPSVITKATEELTIHGFNFTNTGNSVLISSEQLDAFTNLPALDGTTIRFTFHLSAADALNEVLAPFKTEGNYTAVATAIAANIKERIPGIVDAVVPVQIIVTNQNGTSKPVSLLVNMTKIFDEIASSTP